VPVACLGVFFAINILSNSHGPDQLENACNTVRRDRMLMAVEHRCPALLPMVAWAYGRHSCLLVQSSDEVVSSQSRVRQGNPLGPQLFALTLQGPLEEGAAMNLAQPLAYADNTFLQGAPEPTMRAFQALTALARTLPSARQVRCLLCRRPLHHLRCLTARRAPGPRQLSGRRHSGWHLGLPDRHMQTSVPTMHATSWTTCKPCP
jgi:hypothetical protein